MDRRRFSSLLLLTALIFLPAGASGLEVPKLSGRVNDLAGLLTRDQIQTLTTKLADLEATDSTQMAVLIIPSLEGEALEDYSERVASAWKLGVRGNDNGVLLLIAMKERSVRIEVGYGLEAALTDALSRRIIENEIVPGFRQGNYYQGIDDGVTAVIEAVRGVYQASGRARRGPADGTSGRTPLDWVVFLFVPFLWILSSAGRWGGGILGTGAGAYLAYALMGAALLPMLIGGALGGIVGIVLGSLIRAARRSSGRGGFGGGGASGRW